MQYRSDIDSLRAIAVLSVVLFHAFPTLIPGGFVGVDIFFVISGYLIMNIIYRELQDGKFSILSFYSRRIRRLFPALILLYVAVLGYSAVFDLADSFAANAKHVSHSILYFVNITFANEIGYFDPAAETKPLLHLWSLAVEEQFYLFWPLLVWAFYRWPRTRLPLAISFIVLSFWAMIAYSSSEPEKVFYYPHGRIWELLIGATLAWLHTRKLSGAWFESTLSPAQGTTQEFVLHRPFHHISLTAGLCLIFGSLFMLSAETAWPKWVTIWPVMGTALMLHSGNQTSWGIRLLSLRPAVWLGLISYPLYLWHWPILVYARGGSEAALPLLTGIVCVLLAMFLAWLTYKFVETPIRKGRKRRALALGLLGFSALILAIAAWVQVNRGFEQRIFRDNIPHSDIINATQINYGLGKGCSPYLDFSLEDCATAPQPQMLLWGDSYAMHLAQALTASPSEIHFAQTTISACAPFLNFAADYKRYDPEEWIERCMGHNTLSRDLLSSLSSVETVILASPFVLVGKEATLNSQRVTVTDEVFLERLRHSVGEIRALGKSVVVIAPPPWAGHDMGICWQEGIRSNHVAACNFALEDATQRTRDMANLLSQASEFVPVFFLSDLICPDGMCQASIAGQPMYRDGGHLSIRGSAALGREHDLASLLLEMAE